VEAQQVRPRASRLSPDERRAALLDAATRLFAERGPDFTTADLAAAAGVSEGTIFRYFPDKAALVTATRDAAMDLEGLAPLLAVASGLPTLPQRLLAAARALQPRIEQMARAVEHMEHHHHHDGEDETLQQLLEQLAPLFADGAEVTATPEQLATLFLGTLLTNTVLAGKGGTEPLDVDRTVDLFLHGVRPL
jgi:AcrR family transcriptional regulator